MLAELPAYLLAAWKILLSVFLLLLRMLGVEVLCVNVAVTCQSC
jgi:hypothetical protein